ncbi:MAG: hypothetical protein ACE5GM_02405 [bacterium]
MAGKTIYTIQALFPMPFHEKLKARGVKYFRIGACLPHEDDGWNKTFLEEIVKTCLKHEIVPQLLLPIASLDDREKKYLQEIRELLDSYPRAEAVLSSWGQLDAGIKNIKTASVYLDVTNSQELELLKEYGVQAVTVPDNLNKNSLKRLLKKAPPGITLECHLQGGRTVFMGWGDRLPDLPFPLKTKEDWPLKSCKRALHTEQSSVKERPEGISRCLITLFSEKDWQTFNQVCSEDEWTQEA